MIIAMIKAQDATSIMFSSIITAEAQKPLLLRVNAALFTYTLLSISHAQNYVAFTWLQNSSSTIGVAKFLLEINSKRCSFAALKPLNLKVKDLLFRFASYGKKKIICIFNGKVEVKVLTCCSTTLKL